VIIWNLPPRARWSLQHVDGPADMHQGVSLHLSLETFGEFLGSQALALSPLLFSWMLIAMALSLWQGLRQRDDRWLFLFWDGRRRSASCSGSVCARRSRPTGRRQPISRRFIAATAYVWYRWRVIAGKVVEASGVSRCRHGDSAGLGDDRGVARSRPVCPAGIASPALIHWRV